MAGKTEGIRDGAWRTLQSEVVRSGAIVQTIAQLRLASREVPCHDSLRALGR